MYTYYTMKLPGALGNRGDGLLQAQPQQLQADKTPELEPALEKQNYTLADGLKYPNAGHVGFLY